MSRPYINIVTLHGTNKQLQAFYERFVENKEADNGYIVDIVDNDYQDNKIGDMLGFWMDNARNYILSVETVFNNDATDVLRSSALETVKFHTEHVLNKLTDNKVDVTRLLEIIPTYQAIETMDKTSWQKWFKELAKVRTQVTQHAFDVFINPSDDAVFDMAAKEALLLDHVLQFKETNSYRLLNDEELEDFEQNVVWINDETISICFPTKYNPPLEWVEEVCAIYQLEGHIYFGNMENRGHLYIHDDRIEIDCKEPALRDVISLLDGFGLVDAYLEYFGWTDFDLDTQNEDPKYIPVGNLD